MDVHVNVGAFDDAPAALIERAVRVALRQGSDGPGEISVTLLDHDGMRSLNRTYLGRDRPTDVLAFSLDDADLLGDVYVGFERAREQAIDHGVTVDEELVRLAIHGTLHVLGFDHPEGEERASSAMFALQERLVEEVLPRG